MKRALLLLTAMIVGFAIVAQTAKVKQEIKSEKPIFKALSGDMPLNRSAIGKEIPTTKKTQFKSTDVVSIISIGTSANAYGYGYNGGQRNLLNVNNTLNTVSNFHRMGGNLDPGGYSGDLGYDISTDGGMTWTNMVECYVATENAGGQYFLDAGRYPNHGVYNPDGNTDPNEAYVTFFAPNLDNTNDPNLWGGYSYGRAKIGDVNDTTKHLKSSRPADGVYQEVPDGFCQTNNGDVWVVDVNENWSSGALVYMGSLIVNHGVWNEAELDFVYEEMLFELAVQPASTVPAYADVEFSPDGQIGYILALADDGSVDVSTDLSFFPVMWRTEDGGETWTDPFAVAIAGQDGIGAVQDYLSDEEIAELFAEPLPDRDEIPFTTSFDCDLSVDKFGNPHIAVMLGVTGTDAYSIATGISPSSGRAFTCAFMLSSMDKGEEDTWIGYELGRPVSFRGEFGADYEEDNRIQISRDPAGEKMFVSWLDTDTTVSADNNAPDIWVRGVDVINHILTFDENDEPLPQNVTFGSEGTFSAYFFAQGNEVLADGEGNYVIPYAYQNMTPTDPAQPVEFKYIQDFKFTDEDFAFVGVDENPEFSDKLLKVTNSFPNPASGLTTIRLELSEAANVQMNFTNLMGQNMRSIPARYMDAGPNRMVFDVSGLTPGIYFYTVSAGVENITRKIIVE